MPPPNALQSLEYELAAESAASLGRAGARLEEALDALRAFDAAGGARAHRERLLAEAAERLWYYVVQRDVLGFHDSELAMRVYRVPADVRARMGCRR